MDFLPEEFQQRKLMLDWLTMEEASPMYKMMAMDLCLLHSVENLMLDPLKMVSSITGISKPITKTSTDTPNIGMISPRSHMSTTQALKFGSVTTILNLSRLNVTSLNRKELVVVCSGNFQEIEMANSSL